MALIELTEIKKEYLLGTQTVPALKSVTLQIDAGEFVSIIGPSGCGKSTLLNIIGCVDHQTAGKIVINDVDVGKSTEDDLAEFRAAVLGFIFQRFNLLPVLTAMENVEYPLLLNGVTPAEARPRAKKMLDGMGLSDLGNHWPSQLSGGQQQRVAIARALVTDPKIVLADEPTANLDHKTGSEILALMRRMNEERGVTFIFSTHDPKVVAHAKRIVEILDGEISADRPGGDAADVSKEGVNNAG